MDNLQKRPSKGILKNTSSLDSKFQRQSSTDKDLKWDETNILETFHPADKDYGFMKIEEPKTPFSYENTGEESDDEEERKVDPNTLAELLQKAEHPPPHTHDIEMMDALPVDPVHDIDQFDKLSKEEQSKRIEFQDRRKSHYNEYQMVKLARQMMENDEEEEEDANPDGNDVPGPSTSS